MNDLNILQDESLKKYNTYRIDASTKYLAIPNSIEEFVEVLKYCEDNNIKYFILGNGSNVILSNKKFSGMVINTLKLNKVEVNTDKNIIKAEAGAMLPRICQEALNNGLTGLEWASGLPGTIGGSIYGNAGAYLSCIYDNLIDVTIYNKKDVRKIKKEDLYFGYRKSFFKKHKDYIILSATLKLEKGNIEESKELIEKRKARRLESQPLEYPSAGSVFRNPTKEISAGKLIEDANLKGKKINGAKVSEKHANFIINDGNATFDDIIELIDIIKKEIKEKDNIDLICEQEIIDWD